MVETATTTAVASGVPGVAAVAGLGVGLGVVMLVATGIIICLRRKNTALRQKNDALIDSITHQDPSLPHIPDTRPQSYMPGSGTATVVAPSSHVPSMQEFTAFKTMYGNMLAYQNAMEVSGNPQRYSELDATTAAAARHLSRLSVQQPLAFDHIREVPLEHEIHRESSPPPPGPPGRHSPMAGLDSWRP